MSATEVAKQSQQAYLTEAKLKFDAYYRNYQKLMNYHWQPQSVNGIEQENELKVEESAVNNEEQLIPVPEIWRCSSESLGSSSIDVTGSASTIILADGVKSFKKGMDKSNRESMPVNIINMQINVKRRPVEKQRQVTVIQRGNFFQIFDPLKHE